MAWAGSEQVLEIGDAVSSAELAIDGLGFERNVVRELGQRPGWFTTKLLSSEGPLVSDFVTHEPSFAYTSYGIHVGQDDRLTFMGGDGARIRGSFVDCRRGSPTLHARVEISFVATMARRLIIPRGVAHTFDGLARVVTRDEPVWYASDANPDWNIDNDLVSVNRDAGGFPIVGVNEHLLPEAVHQFQSRLSQSLLQDPRPYLARYLLTIGEQEQYVMFNHVAWGADEARELRRLLELPPVPGIQVRRSRYALTGPRSWTLVPNTDACVADVLRLPATAGAVVERALHRRTRVWYTFLDQEGAPLTLDLVDCRGHADTWGARRRLETVCDPRISLAIEPGIAYAIRCPVEVLVRLEEELFVAPDEPREDLPVFGQDLLFVGDGAPLTLGELPTMRCPPALVRMLARHEASAIAGRPDRVDPVADRTADRDTGTQAQERWR